MEKLNSYKNKQFSQDNLFHTLLGLFEVETEVYKKDFVNWSERLNIPDISFKGFVPKLYLPGFLKENGYSTHAMVSMCLACKSAFPR